MLIKTLVPGGARGIELKLNSPNIVAYADKEGLLLEDLIRSSVIISWGIFLSHSLPGHLESHIQRPAIRRFLEVRVDLSAAFLLCTCDDTSWNLTSSSTNATLRSRDHSLSKI